MPFKLRWPFRWPRRKQVAEVAPDQSPAPLPPAAETSRLAEEAARPPTDAGARLAVAGRAPEAVPGPAGSLPLELPEAGDESDAGPDLGHELLGRLPQLSTPPTLGQMGGLPAMAQTLPAVDRFLQQLPSAPVQRLLGGALSQADDFAASLSALSSYGGPAAEAGQLAFSEELPASAGLTDVLPPLGSLPGQVPAISGQAPVLTPVRVTPAGETVLVAKVPRAAAPEAAPPATSPTARTGEAAEIEAAGWAPVAPRPLWPGDWLATTQTGTMTQVLPIESTLAGNVLPQAAFFPVQRALAPYAPEVFAGPRALEAPGERVTPEQRAMIESQRGQGQPLQPEVRQRFETAYGASLADVHVHTGQTAHSTALSLNAIAFASGRDVFFTQNTFQPASPHGLGLIGHELAHVVQQQYGVPGDSEALRPAGDAFERQAEQLAAAALDTPVVSAATSALSGPPVQRAVVGEFIQPSGLAQARAETLEHSVGIETGQRPLDTSPASEAARPVQRFSLADLGNAARNVPTEMPALPRSLPESLPSIDEAVDRVSGLMDQLPTTAGMLSSLRDLPELGSLGNLSDFGQLSDLGSLSGLGGLAQNLPGLGGLGQRLGSLPGNLAENLAGSLPSLGSLPGRPGELAGNLPADLGSLPQLPGGMPSLGGLAHGLGGALPELPQMPGLGELPRLGELPSLTGLQLPEMPLTEGLGGLTEAMGGAAQAGQPALGSITSMVPSAPESPAAPPPLPSLEKLTEHIWKQVQHKLKVERERSRGLA